MSDRTGQTASKLLDATGETIDDAARADARILDSQGQALQRTRAETQDISAQLSEAIRRQPLTAVLAAVGLGLLLGRLTA
jgi:ElaB/YqjD/DUF883 family membrane-anchored ribosome-binding protein